MSNMLLTINRDDLIHLYIAGLIVFVFLVYQVLRALIDGHRFDWTYMAIVCLSIAASLLFEVAKLVYIGYISCCLVTLIKEIYKQITPEENKKQFSWADIVGLGISALGVTAEIVFGILG
ncbi:MAG: hypothetical protein LBM01_00445 [Christensenellaceae bacterium]|jgi:hypothetical protein|nr:hypothetical protein [Christensenellaceae bacterium]